MNTRLHLRQSLNMFEFYLTVSTTENALEVLKDAVKYVLRINSAHNKGTVADTLRNIGAGGGSCQMHGKFF